VTEKSTNRPTQPHPYQSFNQITSNSSSNPGSVPRWQRLSWDIFGVFTLTVACMTLLALFNLTGGKLLTWWAGFLQTLLGWGSFLVVIITTFVGLLMIRQNKEDLVKIPWRRIFAVEAASFAAIALLTLMGGASVERAGQGLDGGLVGWGLVELFSIALQPPWLLGIILSIILLVGLIVGFGITKILTNFAMNQLEEAVETDIPVSRPIVSIGGSNSQEKLPTSSKKKSQHLPSEFRKKFKIQVEEEKPSEPPARDERLPPLNLLVYEKAARPDERHINLTAGLIEKTLSEFGIPAKVIGFRVGPTVTQFAVEPGFIEKTGSEEDAQRQKVRVSQISSLARDLALSLSAERLRIEAPVPGRPYVGIEVPNASSTLVRLRPILETEAFYKFNSPLSIALGRDVSGQAVIADLARMPHLLIAGTTGSGKSVCIAALTTCLVMNNTPEDLRLVMVDPKMVELVRFNGLPHLFGKVETDLERILGVLRWTVSEMDRRYKLLESSRSRNINSYNRKVRRRKGGEPLPHIVVMIDELADLMMSAPDQTEHTVVRLAQMARATGIHLVMATQRPSTDVVTGLIKANFPARISFAVASSVDSRVILDTSGAESLLSHGDMLFLPPEAGSPMRAQCVMVTDQEVENVITFWQKSQPEFDQKPPWEQMFEQEAALAAKDDLLMKAIKTVQETQRASASMLQRRLRIGYPRAARLIDELEDLGVVGPAQSGGREREVFISPEDEMDLSEITKRSTEPEN
jgi:S-DNA-T family DNA segregation ATPase FtsK/SpoIIIE